MKFFILASAVSAVTWEDTPYRIVTKHVDYLTGVEADERFDNFGSPAYMLEKAKAAPDFWQAEADVRAAMTKRIADMRAE